MRLSSIDTRNGGYVLVDLSSPAQLAEVVGLDLSVAANQGAFRQLYSTLLPILSPSISGIVLEPDWSLPLWSDIHSATAEPINAGMILTLADNVDRPTEVPRLDAKWGVDEIKNNYAVALVRLAYHPGEEHALLKKQFMAELKEYCQSQEIDILLDLYLQPVQPEVPPTADDLLAAIQELYKSTSAFILPVPGDALTAATITAELDRPWLARLSEPTYDSNKDKLRFVLESGAKGFLATTFLTNLSQFRHPETGLNFEEVMAFTKTDLRDRLLELGRIVAEA